MMRGVTACKMEGEGFGCGVKWKANEGPGRRVTGEKAGKMELLGLGCRVKMHAI